MTEGQPAYDLGREPFTRRAGYEGNLPGGKTCGDCVHIGRCLAMFGHQATDETCDWVPSRFMEATGSA